MNFMKFKDLYKRSEFVSFILSAVLIIVLLLSSPIFLNVNNLDSLQTAIAPSVIIAVGMMILLITGNFDLSVGSTMGISGVVAALLINNGTNIIIAIVITLLVGAFIGLINGILVAKAGINPLIATIGMMYMVKGVAEIMLVGQGREGYRNFPQAFINIGTGKFLGLYYMFWIMLVILIGFIIFLKITPLGRTFYYMGGDFDAAKKMGFAVDKIQIGTFILSGTLAALAGVIATARYEMANRYMGQGMHMSIIISCIIGGASLAGGKGSMLGAFFGVLFTTLLTNTFNIFEVQPQWQSVVIGAILVIVVASDGYLFIRKQRALGKA